MQSQDTFVQSCLNQLLEQGDVERSDGRYRLTERGERKVTKEIEKYSMRPGLWILIEMWMGERFGIEWSDSDGGSEVSMEGQKRSTAGCH